MLDRLRNAAALMRPRALARMSARLVQLDSDRQTLGADLRLQLQAFGRDLRRREDHDSETRRQQTDSQKQVARQLRELASSIDGLAKSLASMHDTLQKVQLRSEQLTAIVRADAADEAARLEALPAVLQAERASAHAARALAANELQTDPFPHMVVDNLLPHDLYDALIAAIPPRVLFEDRPVNKQQLAVPPRFAPEYSRRVWRFVVRDVMERELRPAILARFRAPLEEYLQRFWPGLSTADPRLPLGASDGRIILRRAGYVIPPHRDPRWGFLTVILYLARKDDPVTWGTQLYRVREDVNAPSAQPYWIGDARCELVKDVPFRRNRALIFLNSDGAHGASLPAEAPPEFERYIYQSRIGPHGQTMRWLMEQLTPEARAAWDGKEGY